MKQRRKITTIQARDFVYLEGTEYILIDVEKGKQMIDHATFESDNHLTTTYFSSACWRGYVAKYFVKNGMLSVVKNPNDDDDIKTEEVSVNYTGSCVIAKGNGCHSDFLVCLFYFDEAFELYFENGFLVEKLSLAPAIFEYRRIKETTILEKETMSHYDSRDFLYTLACKHLKYTYDRSSYKWRKRELDK